MHRSSTVAATVMFLLSVFAWAQSPTTSNVPIDNLADDVAWVTGKHTLEFGGNLRVITSNRISDQTSFLFAYKVPSQDLKTLTVRMTVAAGRVLWAP
jgi:hypothetical protein